jgi:hypothetical protein
VVRLSSSLRDTDLDPREQSVEGEGPVLIYTCALNLLLMSPTYGEDFFLMLLDTIREPGSWTYMLTASSSILLKKIVVLEQAADHLFVMKGSPEDRCLKLRAARVREAGCPPLFDSGIRTGSGSGRCR